MTSFWTSLPNNRLLAEISLWSADLTRLKDNMARMEPYADIYHIDVADAHFVPGLLFFADLVAALRLLTQKPFHVHLMTDNPLAHIDDFAKAGANLITIHAENGDLVPDALAKIRELGLRAGLALQLHTPPEAVIPYLDALDMVMLMGTKLGIKGVGLDEQAYPRITAMKALLYERSLTDHIKIGADGGIRSNTVPLLRAAGADTVVMGSLAFGSTDLDETFRWLHGL